MAPPIRIWSARSRNRSITPTLSLTLAPPRTTTKGRGGSTQQRLQRRQLPLEQEPGDRRQQPGHPLGGGVRPVGGAERVVHVEVRQLGQLGGQGGVVLGLPGIEAGVLQQEHVAGTQVRHGVLDRRPHQLVHLAHRGTQEVGEPGRDRVQAQGRVWAALGPAQMRGQDDLGPLLPQVLDGREGRPDAGVVGDLPVLQRHVEVDADQDALAGHVHVADRLLGHVALSARGAGRRGRPRGWRSPTRCRTRR